MGTTQDFDTKLQAVQFAKRNRKKGYEINVYPIRKWRVNRSRV